VNLTAAYVESLKKGPAPAVRVEVWDQKTPGLCLRIGPSGSATWTFRYRPREGSGFQRITLGKLSDLGLADARERVARHRVQVNDGGDPQRERLAKRAAAKNVLTFERLAERYLDEYAKPRKASWKNDEIYLKRPRAAWSTREARTITRRDAIDLLDEIKATAPVSANRTHSVLVTLFNWAVEDELLDANPIARLKKRAVEHPKERTLPDDEFVLLWRAMEAARISADTKAAFKVLALTGQRPGEVASMRMIELSGLDIAATAKWEIPAEKMKGRRPHLVPITEMVLQTLGGQFVRPKVISKGDGTDFVFASRYADKDRLARHSLSQAMRRVIHELEPDESNKDVVERLQAQPPTPHDLRRTVATKLAELGVPREDRLAVLAHAQGDVHGQHYDKYERLKEKRAALEAWERHVVGFLAKERTR
jgi:integrase